MNYFKLIILSLLTFTFTFCEKDKSTENLIKVNKIDSLFLLNKKTKSINLQKKNLNLIFTELNKLKYDTIVRKKYNELGSEYFYLNQNDEYSKVYNYIESKSTEINDSYGVIEALCNKATFELMNFNYANAYLFLNKAEKKSIAENQLYFLNFIYQNKASIFLTNSEFIKSESYATKSVKLSIKNKEYKRLYNSYLIIGNTLKEQNKHTEAIVYYNKALNTIELLRKESNYNTNLAQPLNYLASSYIALKDYPKALSYIKKALKIDNFKENDKDMFCYLNNNLGLIYLKTNNPKSKLHFLESLKVAKNTKNVFAQNTSNLYLSEYYKNSGELEKSYYHAYEVYKLASENKLTDDKLKSLLLLAESNPSESIRYFEKYKTISDSLLTAERQTRDKFARIEYETDEIINENEHIQQENKNITQRLWSVSSVATIIILIVILIYLVKSRNLKHKELNFIREQQESKEEIYDLMLNQHQHIEEGKYLEKRRISQELHDGVMGKLTAIRLNLFILKKRQDPETIEKCLPIIDEIQHIEKEIRQISHDLNQNLFDDNVTFISIVENLFTMINNHSDIKFNLFVDDRIDWDLINNISKINVYRIIQEALQNIDKYAQATKVILSMKKVGESIQIQITDNGIGFNTNASKKGIGLENMKNRMKEINGTFQIESKNNIGTTISLIFNI